MDALSQEKRVARLRYRRLQQVKLMLRCLEAVAALLLLSWSSARLPAFARLSGHLLGRLVAVLLSPRFVFLVGNAIVLLLFANSGRLHGSPDPATSDSPPADMYDEYLECKSRMLPLSTEPSAQPEAVPVEKPVTPADEAGNKVEEEEEEEEEAAAAEDEVAAEDAEEFRQTIEAFIAKQLRFHREESMGRVRCSGAGAPESSVIACH